MTKYDHLIIGGGIAGVTAAETIRERDANATIGIISDEPHLLYSRVLLPHYLKKRISRGQLFLRKPDDFTKRKIDFRASMKVLGVDPRRREVILSNQEVLGYQKLLISSGGKVVAWGKEEDQKFVYRLQTLDDADRLHRALQEIKNPLVVGNSFISLELLEIFVLNDILPTILFRSQNFFGRIIDSVGGEMLRGNFERQGISVYAGDSVEDVTGHQGQLRVLTKALKEIQCDAIALGIGLEKNTDFLRNSDIELGEKGIRTNEFLETSQEGVFAAGDIAEFYDLISGRQRTLGNWTNAFLQGKWAGLNMLGEKEPFKNVSSYSITNFGFQITALGDCEEGQDTIVRVNTARNEYERFFLKEGGIAGAVLINRFQDKAHLARIIEKKTKVDSYREKLRDFAFDILSITS